MNIRSLPAMLLLALVIGACSGTKEFEAIPKGLDLNSVPKRTFSMTAERFHFTPAEIRVKAGTLVHIDLKSIDGTHGFQLAAFGIDEHLEEGVEKKIEFYAPKPGEYPFRCSHFCGLGHLGMTGKIVVE